MMKIYRNIYLAIIALTLSTAIFIYSLYNLGLSKVSDDSIPRQVTIKRGNINSIAETLYNNNMIRSKLAFNIYVRLNNKKKLLASTYNLSEDMGTKKIVEILNEGKNSKREVNLTFKEGINIRKVATVISQNTNHSEEEFYTLLKDENYLNTLINKYWFLGDEIKNPNIYYSLEGYLYPNTYEIANRDASIESIIEKMLDETNRKLSKYKLALEKNNLSIHQIMTLASIVELEGTNSENRKTIAGVFFNRLNNDMNLGSDVTTYYGVKVDMGERDLYSNEVNACNDYNTRCAKFKVLPISPICNPSIDSVEAALYPKESEYYYFVADKNKKIYFSKDQKEHADIIKELKKEGLWYEY